LLSKQQFKHIGDIEAWVFANEVAAIYGNAKDIAVVLANYPFSIAARTYAKNICALFDYGSLPKEAELGQQPPKRATGIETTKEKWRWVGRVQTWGETKEDKPDKKQVEKVKTYESSTSSEDLKPGGDGPAKRRPKSTYFEVVDTNEGQVHVLTKTR
jgi:hypothetical protein